jgi:hypothetical protein
MRLALAAAVAALLLTAGPAAAETYCVQKPGCVGTARASLAAAIASTDPDPDLDRIEIGPVTLNERDLSAAQPTEIVGSGPSTVIAAPDTNNADRYVLRLNHAQSSISHLSVRVLQTSPTSTYGLSILGGTVDDVDLSSSSDRVNVGITLSGAGVVRNSRVTLPTGPENVPTGIFMTGGGGTAENVDLVAARGVVGTGTVRRARIRARRSGLLNQSAGPMVAEQVLIKLDGATAPGASTGVESSAYAAGGSVSTSVTLRHVTIVGSGTPESYGLDVFAGGAAGTTATGSLDARDVIITNVAHSLRRSASPGPSTSTANLAIDWSDYDPATVTEAGPGTTQIGTNNVSVDPQFRDVTNFDLRLRPTSPLIDRGDPVAPAPSESTLDALGRPRPVDGDGLGDARRDIGGAEYQGRPVVSGLTASPASPVVGEPVTFTATASGSSEGAVVNYDWDFDGNGTFETNTSGLSSTTRGLGTAGPLTVAVRVTAADGAFTDRFLQLTVLPRFAISAFSLSRKTFRVGPKPTAVSAAKRTKAGTSIRYALSTPGTVTVSFARKVLGYRKGKTCVTKKRRGAKRCTRYVFAGKLTRKAPAGASKIAFSGRIGKKALRRGAYRVSLTARDAAGRQVVSRPLAFRIVRR